MILVVASLSSWDGLNLQGKKKKKKNAKGPLAQKQISKVNNETKLPFLVNRSRE